MEANPQAYRAETACLTPHYVRTEEEGRALIREMLLTSADRTAAVKLRAAALASLSFPPSSRYPQTDPGDLFQQPMGFAKRSHSTLVVLEAAGDHLGRV